MKSNYKRLGDYIRIVDERNDFDKKENLLGVSVTKVFIESIANTVGTDFTTYKVVKRNQFTYIPDTSRRGDKIGVALLENREEGLVSQAYTVFEVIDTARLLPQYLMMWFRRPEFDRYARFISHGSVREIFSWEDMCDVKMPIPLIEKQMEIVKEYNTIVNRIDLNNTLIEKLDETAHALYKRWFIDFEFPDQNGQPYKSCGGEFKYIEEVEDDIPTLWKSGELKDLMTFKNGRVCNSGTGTFPVYGGNGITDYSDRYNDERVIALGRVGAYCGSLYRVTEKCWINDNAISAKEIHGFNMYAYYLLKNLNLNQRSEGTGQPLITQGLLNGIGILIPEYNIIELFDNICIKLFNYTDVLEKELIVLSKTKDLLLSKLATMEDNL